MLDKSEKNISSMFNSIALKYDFLNHFLTLGIDKYWRRRVVSFINENVENHNDLIILDAATGTADLSINMSVLKPKKIIGIDISQEMLEIGKSKIKNKKLENVELFYGNVEELSFSDNSFDVITVAFGVRNFSNLRNGINELKRVLKDNGLLIILEFSIPNKSFFSIFFNLYFKRILPLIGKIISNNAIAYKYLFESVQSFPSGDSFVKILKEEIGMRNSSYRKITGGIVSLYYCRK